MSFFVSGKNVSQFSSKNGLDVVLRYPKWEDLQSLWLYMNALSREDTFLALSGESLDIQSQAEWLAGRFVQMEVKNSVVLLAMQGEEVIGVCNIDRNFNNRSRGLHVANFGISLANAYRSQGIGHFFARQSILEAKQKLNDITRIQLTLFSQNQIAYKLYQKLGFKICGQNPEALLYRGNFQDEILMSLKI